MLSKSSVLFITLASLGLQSQMESCNDGNYAHPLHAINQRYHVIPLVSDSVKSAVYISSSYFSSSPNEGADQVDGGKLGGYKTWQLGSTAQAYLGGDVAFGCYKFDTGHVIPQLGFVPGNRSFGSVGLQGGINFVIPFRHFEWRPIGIQLSTHQEFGKYLQFRKSLNPSRHDGVLIQHGNLTTLGFYSEITGRFGYRGDLIVILNKEYDDGDLGGGGYASSTFHYTFQKHLTVYIQTSIAMPFFF